MNHLIGDTIYLHFIEKIFSQSLPDLFEMLLSFVYTSTGRNGAIGGILGGVHLACGGAYTIPLQSLLHVGTFLAHFPSLHITQIYLVFLSILII